MPLFPTYAQPLLYPHHSLEWFMLYQGWTQTHTSSLRVCSSQHGSSQCCAFYGFGQISIYISIYLWTNIYISYYIHCIQYRKEYFLGPKYPLCFTDSYLSPQPLATTDLFIVFTVLLLPECFVLYLESYRMQPFQIAFFFCCQ